MSTIPSDYIDLLYWIKEKTEAYWSRESGEVSGNFVVADWLYGARWIGLTEQEIDAVEARYDVRFMPEHRAFLRILHAIDRMETGVRVDVVEGREEYVVMERPFFYNWIKDETVIREYLSWSFETIWEDVEGTNHVWLKPWGSRPDTADARREIVARWVREAPPLVPLSSHRFLVSDHRLTYRPVLSVWGSDIIVMGNDLRTYLLRELAPALGLVEPVYLEEYNQYDVECKKDMPAFFAEDVKMGKEKKIPYWSEMIDYWRRE